MKQRAPAYKIIPVSVLHDLIDYNPLTGAMVWKPRRLDMFPNLRAQRWWNSVYAGKDSGSVDNNGYVRVSILGVAVRAHRIAWAMKFGEWPPICIDHINHVRSDNRIANLRCVSTQENLKNRPPQKNSAGFVGVYWESVCQKWKVGIGHEGKNIYLGVHSCFGRAVKARREAERRLGFHANHGGVAR
jgi:hypothetical protein